MRCPGKHSSGSGSGSDQAWCAARAEPAGEGKGKGKGAKARKQQQQREMPTDAELEAAFGMMCPSGRGRVGPAELLQVPECQHWLLCVCAKGRGSACHTS